MWILLATLLFLYPLNLQSHLCYTRLRADLRGLHVVTQLTVLQQHLSYLKVQLNLWSSKSQPRVNPGFSPGAWPFPLGLARSLGPGPFPRAWPFPWFCQNDLLNLHLPDSATPPAPKSIADGVRTKKKNSKGRNKGNRNYRGPYATNHT